jgi:pimeloyl-ACP methyl ester carboxylesterase
MARAIGLVGVVLCGVLALPAVSQAGRPLEAPAPSMKEGTAQAAAGSLALHSARKAPPPMANLEECEQAPGGFCGRVEVPLDRKRPARGTVSLFFEYYPRRDGAPTDQAIFVTEGGPGFAVTTGGGGFISDFYLGLFDPLLDERGLIMLDQRGVGGSDVIDCPSVQNGIDDFFGDIRACGDRLGFASSLYSTAEVARDVEAVRRALGVDKLDYYGASYAGLDIQAYAVRFGKHLSSAVLDSSVPTDGFDTFDPTSARQVARVAKLICARSPSCSAAQPDARRELAWLADRVRRRPVEGVGIDAEGNEQHVRVTEGYLIFNMVYSEFGGYVASSEIAAAAAALRQGDKAPLVRLAAESAGPIFGEGSDLAEFSEGHNWARYCTDTPFVWDEDASLSTRLRQWNRARSRLDPRDFGPFSIDGWLSPFPVGPLGPDGCIAWPAPKGKVERPVPKGAKFPSKVPSLHITGDLDMSIPPEYSRQVARRWRGSDYVDVANNGHHGVLHARGDCAGPIVVNFIAEHDPGDTSCARQKELRFPAVGRFAKVAADARRAKRAPGDASTELDRRVVTAATAAVTDAFRRGFMVGAPQGAGLRGGTFSFEFGETSAAAELDGVRFARDVAVSGSGDYGYEGEFLDSTVDVDGPGGRDGSLHIAGVWWGTRNLATVLEVTGTIGGRNVVLEVPAG